MTLEVITLSHSYGIDCNILVGATYGTRESVKRNSSLTYEVRLFLVVVIFIFFGRESNPEPFVPRMVLYNQGMPAPRNERLRVTVPVHLPRGVPRVLQR